MLGKRFKSPAAQAFDIANYLFLLLLGLMCVLPLVHVLAVSFSDKSAAAANMVKLIPVNFQLLGYREIFRNSGFISSFVISVGRALAGTSLNMLLIILAAYPLSLEFKGRGVFVWLFFFPMLFSGGLIPTYLLMKGLNLINKYLALILNQTVVPIFSAIILMNFFRSLPKSLGESAKVDGASHWVIMTRIYVPLSMASIATLILFSLVMHWNEWFMALIYMTDSAKYPLQTRLQQMVVSIDFANLTKEEIELLDKLSDRTFKAAQIIVATLPILCVYPFLQKYFVKGIVLGAVKG